MVNELSQWTFFLVAAVATLLPRALGALAAGRLDPTSRIFEWMTCVAYAMASGLALRMLFYPTGALGETLLLDRLIAAIVALTIFFLMKRQLLFGFASGVFVFWAIGFLRLSQFN
ncbi:MAG: hypothetical protein CMM41_07455 [Rhodospirillaceae bacterium]|nr:hypothetical protein [Rhodospirillaceae bacterium]